MDSLQTKVQKGLNNMQRGIEEGKNKIQSSQEILALREEVNQLEESRTYFIFELGEMTYKKIRDNEISEEDFKTLGLEVSILDRKIFNLLKAIDEKSKREEDLLCMCGAKLTHNDRFCKECGKKVDVFTSSDSNETLLCKNCETENTSDNNYCNCCGKKIQ